MEFIYIIIALLSFIVLLAIHEFGHFYIAKRFGIKVLEFGIGLPPRIIGKKIGETIYSINAIPFGAFVRMLGEEPNEKVDDPASFSAKPVWQRVLVVLGGVLAFWILAFFLFSLQNFIGSVKVDNTDKYIPGSKIVITSVLKDSPAEKAGVPSPSEVLYAKEGKTIHKFNNIQDFIKFVSERPQREFILGVKNAQGDDLEVPISPSLKEEGKGMIGVQINRVYFEKSPLHEAFINGAKDTYFTTKMVILGFFDLIRGGVQGEPVGDRVAGPVKIFTLLADFASSSLAEYLRFIAIISISLAVLNILPIPALDGGKLMFLAIEAVRRKPVNKDIESKVTTFFFFMLLALIAWVSFREVLDLIK